ncbi:MAG TPA: M20/M25/M40 family metallo-hydrolase [Anaeromyxobacteraceae bacterium]|nr:M20/M25/M40 family metallo-hydrolase [Anaeromyxobacteraceae bacterium]
MGEGTARGRALLLGVALMGAVALAAALGLRPTSPRSEAAPPESFSAARAGRILQDLVGDGAPHPVGSAAAARVRERVLAELRRLGLEPEVQEAFACGRYWMCATVRNVLARLPGREPGPAVLLMAHYDSVPAGPGASDDGVGVAALLEAARALRHDPPRRPVILLLDDGEEAGLVGATAFAEGHPWMREVGAVVNLEARGTSGASLLFQTSGDDLWLARLAGRALAHPVTSSLFAEVYRRLPNDTDLSVFGPRGLPGLDFAFVGDAGRYHTPLDDLAHADRGSLQHHGDNALAAVRALAGSDLVAPPPGRGAFFDLLGHRVIAWPRQWSPWLLALAAALLAAGALEAGPERPRPRAVGVGLVGFAAAPVAGFALALAAWLALRAAGVLSRPFVAFPGPVVWLAFGAGASGAALAAALAGPRAGAAGLRAGAGLGWLVPAGALLLVAPGAAHLFLVPALAAGLAAAVRALAGERLAAAGDLGTALAGGVVILPVALLLPDALGHAAAPLVAFLSALALSPLSPLAASLAPPWRRLLVAAPLSAAAAAAAVAALAPQATADRPEQVLVFHHQDADQAGGRVLVWAETGRLPASMRLAAPFGADAARPLPWAAVRPSFAAAVPRHDLAAPEVEVLSRSEEAGRRRLRLRLVSPRRAADVSLLLPPDAEVVSAAMDGVTLPPLDPRLRRWFGGWRPLRCLTAPAGGVEVDLVVAGSGPLEAWVADQSPGLPAEAGRVAAARPPEAAPVQEGDSTLVTRRVRL